LVFRNQLNLGRKALRAAQFEWLRSPATSVTCSPSRSVCPGYVLTRRVEKQIPDTAKARGITEEQVVKDVLLAAQPTKQFVTVAEVAELTMFLASDDAASITGAIMPIDGGWTAH
jgi:NAD(P)-dependent dehydrogenase (short-subunit alcohol dehydrogenase family)